MKMPSTLPRLKSYRFPREIIAYAVWAYHRFALRTADVEDLLAERGVTVSRETVRNWVNRFKSNRQAQRFLTAHDQINLIFRPRRYQLTATSYRHARNDAFSLWGDYAAEMAA